MSESLFVEDASEGEQATEKELTELLKKDAEDDNQKLHGVEPDADTNTSASSVEINLTLSLNYQHQIVQELLTEDGLVILGRGLALDAIVSNLLHVMSLSVIRDKKSLVLLVNATEFENFKIGEQLRELSWLDSDEQKPTFHSISGDPTTLDKRRKLYEKGGILSISNRILVTDLLGEIIDANMITGMVILHAEKIKEYSSERFIVNLYRRKNKWGFIKAFSDEPEALAVGFQPLYTKLKYLRLERAMLWPRFHVDVTNSLRSSKLDSKVTEVNVQLSKYMLKIQTGLMACIEACIGELRRHNPELSTEYWSMENALDDNFVRSIRATLDPSWHRVSYTSKQIVHELGTLKTLLAHLFSLDSVQFYQELASIVEANKPSVTNRNKAVAPWLLLDEAMTVISCAKARVFDKIKDSDAGDNSEATYLLEELPKWEQLALILDDINQDKQRSNSTEDGPVLIMCSSLHVCSQLRTFLTGYKEYQHSNSKSFSARKIMVRLLRQHLTWKKEAGNRALKIQKELNKNPNPAEKPQGGANGDKEELTISKTFVRGRAPPTKRRRMRGGATMTSYNRMLNKTEDGSNNDVDENIVELLEDEIAEDRSDDEDDLEDENYKEKEKVEDAFEAFLEGIEQTPDVVEVQGGKQSFGLMYEYVNRSDQIIIEKFDSKSNDLLLEEIMPSYIILYEPDLAFIRKVEIYQSMRHTKPAKCFFMYYGSSIEEQLYLNSIKQEKDAFTRLIREKSSLPKTFITEEDETSKFLTDTATTNTRIAGGNPVEVKNKVIVDVREFRSQLPFLCHLAALDVIPCMLTVGDYILSPKICIERKSIPDLIGSLKSGRLYQQCEQMFRYYELPTLLIEFEEGKSFSLEPFATYRDGRANNGPSGSALATTGFQQDLQLKLMMLLVSFPTLKIIWSSSPFETAKVFRELKMTQDEPDVNKSINAGVNPMFDADTYFNDTAIDLIQNIPGISSVNSHLIINKVKNIKELSQISEKELSKLVGAEAASKIVGFFKRNI